MNTEIQIFAKLEAHHEVGLGETPHRLIRKRCRYSSIENYEDVFDTALDLIQKTKALQDKWQSEQSAGLVGALVFLGIAWYKAR